MPWKNNDQDVCVFGLRQAKAYKEYVGGTRKRSRWNDQRSKAAEIEKIDGAI